MQRYFTDFNDDDEIIKITGVSYHHIKNVMRMKQNDEFYVTNSRKALCVKISEIKEDCVICEKLYELKDNNELPVQVAVAQGMPKGDKFEFIIQKTTELGVSEIIPVLSERSLVKTDESKETRKIERYHKIASEAAEQSQRLISPGIKPFMKLEELIVYAEEFQYKLVAYEDSENSRGLQAVLSSVKPGEGILVFIGPEGGISPKELAMLVEHGFESISFGKRILRTETAPVFFMSAIVYELELKG